MDQVNIAIDERRGRAAVRGGEESDRGLSTSPEPRGQMRDPAAAAPPAPAAVQLQLARRARAAQRMRSAGLWSGRIDSRAPSAEPLAPTTLFDAIAKCKWRRGDDTAAIVSLEWWRAYKVYKLGSNYGASAPPPPEPLSTSTLRMRNLKTLGEESEESGNDMFAEDEYFGLEAAATRSNGDDIRVIPFSAGLLLHAQYGGDLIVHPLVPRAVRAAAEKGSSRVELSCLRVSIEFWRAEETIQFVGAYPIFPAGSIRSIHSAKMQKSGFTPVLQLINIKQINQSPPERYRLILSDGEHFQQAMLSSRLNGLIKERAMVEMCFVRLNEFTVNEVQGRRIIIVLSIEVMSGPAAKSGTPKNIAKAAPTARSRFEDGLGRGAQGDEVVVFELAMSHYATTDQLHAAAIKQLSLCSPRTADADVSAMQFRFWKSLRDGRTRLPSLREELLPRISLHSIVSDANLLHVRMHGRSTARHSLNNSWGSAIDAHDAQVAAATLGAAAERRGASVAAAGAAAVPSSSAPLSPWVVWLGAAPSSLTPRSCDVLSQAVMSKKTRFATAELELRDLPADAEQARHPRLPYASTAKLLAWLRRLPEVNEVTCSDSVLREIVARVPRTLDELKSIESSSINDELKWVLPFIRKWFTICDESQIGSSLARTSCADAGYTALRMTFGAAMLDGVPRGLFENAIVDLDQMVIAIPIPDVSIRVRHHVWDRGDGTVATLLKRPPGLQTLIETSRCEAASVSGDAVKKPFALFHIHGSLFGSSVPRSVPRSWSLMPPSGLGPPELIDEDADSATFEWAQSLMCLRGNRFEVTRLQRVQHLPLWQRYASLRRQMEESGSSAAHLSSSSSSSSSAAGFPSFSCSSSASVRSASSASAADERWLFHGTRKTPPAQITVEGEGGFDTRLSNGRYYGRGNYFTNSPTYAHKYRYDLPRVGNPWDTSPARHQIFIASVLCGAAKDYGSSKDPSLMRPPPLPGAARLYDSVTGNPDQKSNEQMHVIYKNDQAYPRYLVTYEVRDPLSDRKQYVEHELRKHLPFQVMRKSKTELCNEAKMHVLRRASLGEQASGGGGGDPWCDPPRRASREELRHPTQLAELHAWASKRIRAVAMPRLPRASNFFAPPRGGFSTAAAAVSTIVDASDGELIFVAPPPPPSILTPVVCGDEKIDALMAATSRMTPPAGIHQATAHDKSHVLCTLNPAEQAQWNAFALQPPYRPPPPPPAALWRGLPISMIAPLAGAHTIYADGDEARATDQTSRSVWEWFEHGTWHPYAVADDLAVVARARLSSGGRRGATPITIRGQVYTIDFTALTQTNSLTLYARNIRRRVTGSAPPPPLPPPPPPLVAQPVSSAASGGRSRVTRSRTYGGGRRTAPVSAFVPPPPPVSAAIKIPKLRRTHPPPPGRRRAAAAPPAPRAAAAPHASSNQAFNQRRAHAYTQNAQAAATSAAAPGGVQAPPAKRAKLITNPNSGTPPPTMWACHACTLYNDMTSYVCAACNTSRAYPPGVQL